MSQYSLLRDRIEPPGSFLAVFLQAHISNLQPDRKERPGRIDAFFGTSGIFFSSLNHPPSTLDLQPGQMPGCILTSAAAS
jgi:hypothetical protein